MKESMTKTFLIAGALLPLFYYMYNKGCGDGVARYRKSRQFEMTLESQYRFGWNDGFVYGYGTCKEGK